MPTAHALAELNNNYRPFNLGSIAPFTATELQQDLQFYTAAKARRSLANAKASAARWTEIATQRRTDGLERFAQDADFDAAKERGSALYFAELLRVIRTATCA
jgi:hypothetical protein